ncbi:MAG: hypothetical protein ACT4O2_06130 [Beijerinckiaceae bacterium]
MANSVTRLLMGYSRNELGENELPEIDYSDDKVRWAFLFGESGFGVYDGREVRAGRYSKRTSQLAYRPVYKLVDKSTRETLSPSISDGMLDNEWVTVIRRRDRGRFKTVIAGMPGTGTEAFFSNFRLNVAHLYQMTERIDQYQLIVPVALDHSAGLDRVNRTTGTIDWPHARLHVIA